MALEFVVDVLEDETHAQLDRKVLRRAHRLEDPLGPSDYLRLLVYIALESKERIDPKYKNIDEAEEALDHDGVLAELEVAWKAKAFKNIRNLGTNLHLLLIIYVFTVTHAAILQPPSSPRNRHHRSWMNSDAQSE